MISETPQRKKEWLKNMQGKILKNTLKLRRGILTAMPKAGKIDEPRLGGGGPARGRGRQNTTITLIEIVLMPNHLCNKKNF